ncbi:MAG: hypothetical protein RBT49_01165 [Bacteroidales bacterium]|jgi:hypothetical protein|nr:hypothetical protein [Bacteroidales bacterium]
MKKLCLFILFLANSITCISQGDSSLLIGRWINYYNRNNHLVFDSDSFKIFNNNFEYTQAWSLKQPGVFLTHYGINEASFPYYYCFLDSFMVVLTLKPNLDQIDELSLFTKDILNKPPVLRNSKIKFVINNYKPGLYMVLLPNFIKSNPNYVAVDSVREIIISNRFIKSSIRMTPIDYALKNFEFYLNGQIIPVFLSNEFIDISKNQSIRDKDIVVGVYGYNQIGRETINAKMNEIVIGDLLMFFIGPYEEFKIYPTAVDF